MSVLLLLAFCLLQSNVNAQENEETPFWYVSFYEVGWEKIDSLSKLVTMYTVPMIAQAKKNGSILDYELLIHHTGDSKNVVQMVKFPSWSAIGEDWGFGKAMEAIEPDKAKRDEINVAFAWCFGATDNHTDNIYWDAMHKGEEEAKKKE